MVIHAHYKKIRNTRSFTLRFLCVAKTRAMLALIKTENFLCSATVARAGNASPRDQQICRSTA